METKPMLHQGMHASIELETRWQQQLVHVLAMQCSCILCEGLAHKLAAPIAHSSASPLRG